jgi:hypothetical protein
VFLKYWGEGAKNVVGIAASQPDDCGSKLMMSAGEAISGQQQGSSSSSNRDTGCGEVMARDPVTSPMA